MFITTCNLQHTHRNTVHERFRSPSGPQTSYFIWTPCVLQTGSPIFLLKDSLYLVIRTDSCGWGLRLTFLAIDLLILIKQDQLFSSWLPCFCTWNTFKTILTLNTTNMPVPVSLLWRLHVHLAFHNRPWNLKKKIPYEIFGTANAVDQYHWKFDRLVFATVCKRGIWGTQARLVIVMIFLKSDVMFYFAIIAKLYYDTVLIFFLVIHRYHDWPWIKWVRHV